MLFIQCKRTRGLAQHTVCRAKQLAGSCEKQLHCCAPCTTNGRADIATSLLLQCKHCVRRHKQVHKAYKLRRAHHDTKQLPPCFSLLQMQPAIPHHTMLHTLATGTCSRPPSTRLLHMPPPPTMKQLATNQHSAVHHAPRMHHLILLLSRPQSLPSIPHRCC